VIQFGPEEVNLMIANADKDAGDGRYEKAIQEYRIALRYEPKNQHALQGLARAVRNQEQQ
jgi:cytochrome c-type biogenesis protein CcmH/NrfG